MFDITQFSPTDTSFLHLKAPDTEEPILVKDGDGDDAQLVPVGITFHNPGSAAYEAASSKRTNRSLTRSRKKIDLNADLLRSDNTNFLAEVTVSFDQLAYPVAQGARGEDLFKALYADRRFGWVVEQANAFLADWANFTKRSEAS